MFGFGPLGPRSIQDSLKRMAARAAVAGPFQIIGFYIGASLRDDGLSSPVLTAAFVTLVAVMVLRFGLWRSADRMLAQRATRAAWRLGFGLTSVSIALAWCTLAVMGHSAFHLDARMSVTILFCSSIACISTQAFAFELGLNLIFQLLMLVPPAVVFLLGDTRTDHYLGTGMLFYTLFTCYLAYSQSKSLRESLRKNEIIDEQRLKLARANDEIAAMIDSIEEVFLIFDPRGVCVSAPSRTSRRVLGQDITNRQFLDLIPLPAADAEAARGWLALIVEQPERFEVFAPLGPQECVIDGRELSLKYNALHGAEGRFNGLVLTVKDVTREREAARQARTERYRADLILGAQEHPAKLRKLLTEVEAAADDLARFAGDELNARLQTLHTLKGAARVIGAWDVAQLVHQCELAVRNGNVGISAAGVDLGVHYRAWLDRERELLRKLGVFNDGVLRISEARLRAVLTDEDLIRVTARDLGDVLRGYQAHVRQTGERLRKRVELRVEGPPLDLSRDRFAEVLDTLRHVLNNSVDHGIESPVERQSVGKGEVGVIQARYAREGRWLELVIEDDGRGIDVERVRAKLRSRGVAGADQMPADEVIQHIFDSGVSTAERVTELSGLGVGLGAVKNAVERATGSVAVSTGPVGTKFRIRLPFAA